MTLLRRRSLGLKALVFGLAIAFSVVLVELAFYPLGIARGDEPQILLAVLAGLLAGALMYYRLRRHELRG